MSYGTYNPVECDWVWKTCKKCRKDCEIQDWLASSRPKCGTCELAENEKRDARRQKLRKAGLSKLTRAERDALGLVGKKW